MIRPPGRAPTIALDYAKLPLVPLDLVVKGAGQVRRCTIPAAAVRNVLER
jgi:hypothetical protein